MFLFSESAEGFDTCQADGEQGKVAPALARSSGHTY